MSECFVVDIVVVVVVALIVVAAVAVVAVVAGCCFCFLWYNSKYIQGKRESEEEVLQLPMQ